MLGLKTQGGAESMAYDLALRMTAARATGAPVTGLGLDWSKCYDHVHVGILDAISTRADNRGGFCCVILVAKSELPATAFLLGVPGPRIGSPY